MSQIPPGAEPSAIVGDSVPRAEKSASASANGGDRPSRTPKPRSCLVCRSRKVRCDKQLPCSNCRRANIACVLPSADRPPRWARRLEAPAVGEFMERIHHLENLVNVLRGQLEQANASAKSPAGSSHSPGSSTHERDTNHHGDTSSSQSETQKQFGRLVSQDTPSSRYVSNGFWSRVNDELSELKIDAHDLVAEDSEFSDEDESSFGKTPSTQELDRTPSDRHGFLFKHNLSSRSPDLREFHPLPSQIPFLVDVYCENVNALNQVLHPPTVMAMVRNLRGDMTKLTPANEALMFSIYYAAVTSMEEEDVNLNFGTTKTDLNLKYRLGLEHALARADFLNTPDLTLLQAFAIFLCLVRRHDSPRFVWMMTGLAIRMGLALGLHRDGSNFKHLTPFEIEMRRRTWWILCVIDVRASEDQGTDYTIAPGSFDTKIPMNINNADINPDMKEMPVEGTGLTELSFTRISLITCDFTKQMLSHGSKASNLDEQGRLVKEVYRRLEEDYLQYSTESSMAYWTGVTITRLVMAKMTLLVYLPVLFSADKHISDDLRSKLLIEAIEVAEYNHALNSEQGCRHWRWVFQTYTHWHAIVYILIEMLRRPWSPIVERAWVALHSVWLIPAQCSVDKNMHVWFPLRKLMAKAKKHRHAEILRLRGSVQAAKELEMSDNVSLPSSPAPFPAGSDSAETFLNRWRLLVSGQQGPLSSIGDGSAQTIVDSNLSLPKDHIGNAPLASEPMAMGPDGSHPQSTSTYIAPVQTLGMNQDLDQLSSQPSNIDLIPWLWRDEDLANITLDPVDSNMDLDGGEVDWYNWVESAKGAEWN